VDSLFTGKQDFSAGTNDAVPGKSFRVGGAESPDYLARCSRVACGLRHAAIGYNLAPGDFADHLVNIFKVPHRLSLAAGNWLPTTPFSMTVPSVLESLQPERFPRPEFGPPAV
jgi:hypothetical protein